jgi:hypothetical protein
MEQKPESGEVIIDDLRVTVSKTDLQSANILAVTVGTNCPRGGDTGHGGRTVLILENESGTGDVRCGIDGAEPESVSRIEIVTGGDTECETLIDALEFAVNALKKQTQRK